MPWNSLEISQDAKSILNELRNRKRKMDDLQSKAIVYSVGAVFFLLIYFFGFDKLILKPTNGNVRLMLEILPKTFILHILLIISLVSVFISIDATKKYKKMKDKVEKLRTEIADKLWAPWVKTNMSQMRDKLTQQIKEETNLDIFMNS
ncbi:DUF2663 family protein [Paenibacillus filicis]|uniref:DUF2663 family protein n=1 Tax=Paenibacillus gyeongsangnamensis TaxID=3388067 RepID=A0ABT4QJI4_9BACL|nr:DUF2663 family protein [Paenibacillus filicis]MCZ8517020.1 DUF2663 family protein [Paenibacillus filicis]